nr:hypothetical protein [Tanacetum cinerariifolium]
MLADFLVEIPSEDNERKEKPKEVPNLSSNWRLYTDGASNSDGSGAGIRSIASRSTDSPGNGNCKSSNIPGLATSEHMEIMHHIGRQLTRSQQGLVDNLAKTLWIHRTLPRNSEKETPFSLTYGSEAMIPIIETTDDRGRVQKATKGKESKEVASIEKAYYRNKLREYHNARSSHPTYIVGDFILLKQNMNEWQGPYLTAKGTNLHKFYM